MLGSIAKILVLLAVLSITFVLGAISAVRYHWGSPIATITVRNDTLKKIQSISVTYTTCGAIQRLYFSVPDQPATHTVERDVSMRIVLCGEGSHTTEVMFSDGKIFRSRGSYIEGSYVVTEIVKDSGIISEYTRTLP